jgi:hypothetical protein
LQETSRSGAAAGRRRFIEQRGKQRKARLVS